MQINNAGTDLFCTQLILSEQLLFKMSEVVATRKSVLDQQTLSGDLETMLGRRDLLWMIHALLEDAFTGRTKGYDSIPDEQKTSYEAVHDALKAIGTYSDSNCDGHEYNAAAYLQQNDINYCTPEAYR